MNEAVLAGLVKHLRPRILRDFRPDSCVATVRAATLVANHFGVTLTPQLVKVRVMNPMYTRLVTAKGGGGPHTEAEAMVWREKGAWEVALGYGADPFLIRKGGLDGHLVALTDNGRLLDLSLDQANRPQRNITVGPILTKLTEHWQGPSDKAGHIVYVGESMVMYTRLPNESARWRGPDWDDVSRVGPAVLDVIRSIEWDLTKQ